MKFKVISIIVWIFLTSTALVAQRLPIPGQGQQQFPTQGARNRQIVNPEGEDQEKGGRRKLIDDSTKMVFGPKTTLNFLEKDVKRNRIQKTEVDTLLNNFHYYEPVAKSGWMYQDLGNIGSAARPLLFMLPRQIGMTSGFHVYDLYHRSADSMRYMDTKSPYTQMNAFFGGGNRNMLDIAFARNVNPRWNLGLNFNTIRARKMLNPSGRDDLLADHVSYSFHTNYRSENGKYLLLANYSRMSHKVDEQGGIIPPEIDENSLLFAYEDAKVWLRNSNARDLRQELHLYHEYELVKGWQLYHVIDRKNQLVTFESDLQSADSSFFRLYNPVRFNSQDSTFNSNRFSEWRNEAGFKGDLGPLYYNAFVKFRTGAMNSPFFEATNRFNEVYIGGALRGEISKNWRFEAEGEYLLPSAFRLHGLFVSPWLEASYTKGLYRPTSMQLLYSGNHHRWENDFSNIGVDQVNAVMKLDFARWSFRPNISISRINNFVFFDQQQQAQQSEGGIFILNPGLKFSFNIAKKFFWQGDIYYTDISGAGKDNIRIPQTIVNTKIFYESPMFDENIFVQIGVEGRYRSDNLSDAYSPAIQQFYLQNTFNVFAYPVADLFFNARINRTRILLRFNHININTGAQPGYFVTPYFTGLRRALDIGISWPLFD